MREVKRRKMYYLTALNDNIDKLSVMNKTKLQVIPVIKDERSKVACNRIHNLTDANNFFALTEIKYKDPIFYSNLHKINEEAKNYKELSARKEQKKVNRGNKKAISVKDFGLEGTEYYKKYMAPIDPNLRLKQTKPLFSNYLQHTKDQVISTEHFRCSNRIMKKMNVKSKRRTFNLSFSLESNLDNAFRRISKNLDQVIPYIKYDNALLLT